MIFYLLLIVFNQTTFSWGWFIGSIIYEVLIGLANKD